MNYKEKRILEIGEEFNPRLAIRISKKLTSGKITVYDPSIYKTIKNSIIGYTHILSSLVKNIMEIIIPSNILLSIFLFL